MDIPAPALASYAEQRTPWRKAAIVTAGIAALELVALLVIALAFIAKPLADDGAKPANAKPAKAEPAKAAAPEAAAKTPAPEPVVATAKLPRAKTSVLVLNGNGVSGAAGTAAERLRALRYPVAGVSDASRRDFPRTIVMYRAQFRGEAQRLARDLGLSLDRAVPLDGLRAADLGGARLALVIGG